MNTDIEIDYYQKCLLNVIRLGDFKAGNSWKT